jgi:hypothetical protein
MDGWYITGDNGQLLYTFDEEIVLHPGQRFVVCEDRDRFNDVFPIRMYCFGNLDQDFSTSPTLTLRSADGKIRKTVSLMASPDWPSLPAEGFSLELRNITEKTDIGSNWEISENIFGSPGLPNHQFYNFQAPTGKESVFSNLETHTLEFISSEEYYHDPDLHQMAGIFVKKLTGPGKMYLGDTMLEQGKVYDPADLIFSPEEPLSSGSSLEYSFIDRSGQESSVHTIQFNPMVRATQTSRERFHIYPIPARDFCILDLPPDFQGPLYFYLFDLNGRLLKSLQTISTGKQLHIDLTRMDSGIYFFLIKTRESLINGKIEVIK